MLMRYFQTPYLWSDLHVTFFKKNSQFLSISQPCSYSQSFYNLINSLLQFLLPINLSQFLECMKHCTFYDFHFYLTNNIFHLYLLMSNLIILRLLSSCCKTTVLENFFPSKPKIYLIIVHCLKSVICSDPNSLCKHSHHLQINSQMILQICLGDLQFHQAGSFYNYTCICIQTFSI